MDPVVTACRVVTLSTEAERELAARVVEICLQHGLGFEAALDVARVLVPRRWGS